MNLQETVSRIFPGCTATGVVEDDGVVEVAGLTSGDDEIVRGDMAAGDKFSLIHLSRGQVVGASCVNNVRDFTALKRLITSGAQPDRAALADPATDLRKLITQTASPSA